MWWGKLATRWAFCQLKEAKNKPNKETVSFYTVSLWWRIGDSTAKVSEYFYANIT